MTKKIIYIIIILVILILLPLIGNTTYSITDYLHLSDNYILYKIRIPQVITAFLIGVILSISGLIYQTIFRNDLAEPYTLGVSSGSAFGAVLAIKLNLYFAIAGVHGISLFSFMFGILTILLLLFLTRLRKTFNNFSLLLTGIALNYFFSAAILLLTYLSNFEESFAIHRWLLGSISETDYNNVVLLSLVLVPTYIVLYFFAKELNLILLGDDLAQSKGLNVKKTKIILLILTSLIVSIAVSISGPIGFIGLVCPHIIRLIFGYNIKKIYIISGLFGGLFLAVCDTLSRTVIYPAILPVGIITAFLGGPFLMYLLFRRK